MFALSTVNPFLACRLNRKHSSVGHVPQAEPPRPVYAKLPAAPITASPVPHLTSLYHSAEAGDYGDRAYPGNCGGNLIKDLLRYFGPSSVFDPMTGSGTCRDVCDELGVYCWSSDIREGADACDASQFPRACFQFAWIHPPYWRMKVYTDDPRDLSRTPTLEAFLDRYQLLIDNCAGSLVPGGKLAILMGDYSDREAGYVPLVFYTKLLAFRTGVRQHCTDIIRAQELSSFPKSQPLHISLNACQSSTCATRLTLPFSRLGPNSSRDRFLCWADDFERARAPMRSHMRK